MGFSGNWPDQSTSPAKKMPLIDVYVETAAGGESHCTWMGNYFSRISTSVVIRKKQQSLGRDTQDRQTQIRSSKKWDCRSCSPAILNGKCLITPDGLEPAGGGRGAWKR